MTLNSKEIGKRIRKLRLSQNLAQDDVAAKINLSVSHYSHIECGDRTPSIDTVINLSNLFDCSCDYILLGSQSKEITYNQLADVIANCSPRQLEAILTIAKLFTDKAE